MGYYTYHSLYVDGAHDNKLEDYKKEISERSGYADLFVDECKWYEHEQEMREYSLLHPDVLFELHGEGEDTGDLWIEYYKNGKMQRCDGEIIYPPFDETKMQ